MLRLILLFHHELKSNLFMRKRKANLGIFRIVWENSLVELVGGPSPPHSAILQSTIAILCLWLEIFENKWKTSREKERERERMLSARESAVDLRIIGPKQRRNKHLRFDGAVRSYRPPIFQVFHCFSVFSGFREFSLL